MIGTFDYMIEDKGITTLTWDVMNARGFDVGDLAGIFTLCVELGKMQEDCFSLRNAIIIGLVQAGLEDGAMNAINGVNMHYMALDGYINRDIGEMLKFLAIRKFDFPDDSPFMAKE